MVQIAILKNYCNSQPFTQDYSKCSDSLSEQMRAVVDDNWVGLRGNAELARLEHRPEGVLAPTDYSNNLQPLSL